MSSLTNYERETILHFNESEGTASVYTHNKALRRRLERLAQERQDECRPFKAARQKEAVEYYIPKSWVKITPPRILTEEHRAALAEQLKNAVLAKRAPANRGDHALVPGSEGKDTTPHPGT